LKPNQPININQPAITAAFRQLTADDGGLAGYRHSSGMAPPMQADRGVVNAPLETLVLYWIYHSKALCWGQL